MHDEGLGIPVYSAYVLHAGNVNFQSRAGVGWIQTPGNVFHMYPLTMIRTLLRAFIPSKLYLHMHRSPPMIYIASLVENENAVVDPRVALKRV